MFNAFKLKKMANRHFRTNIDNAVKTNSGI